MLAIGIPTGLKMDTNIGPFNLVHHIFTLILTTLPKIACKINVNSIRISYTLYIIEKIDEQIVNTYIIKL